MQTNNSYSGADSEMILGGITTSIGEVNQMV